uniref:Secreted protein, acidic, cysteine-rich (osteonectin) n=1 Tax=Esox lucius TaxID=8010 RepID=A0A3P9AL32_ESOLU
MDRPTMRVWIIFLLCLAGQAFAASITEEQPILDEPVVEEEPIMEEDEVMPEGGANPVQVETGEFDEAIEIIEEDVNAENPCLNHHCKKGKVCEVDEENTPMCVCQDPTSCPASVGEFEHVSCRHRTHYSKTGFNHLYIPRPFGKCPWPFFSFYVIMSDFCICVSQVCATDNTTYDSSCHFFAHKCSLEGTKKGHKLHLDYIGPCKFIEPCLDAELNEFPLRMRDWLKNVLVTLYERDEENNLLTEKQKLRVKKIYENEKRLQAGDHSLDLLAHDFEKNYNMYIFPVHWQFGQLDQHPIDGFLSHTELAPLRAPLIPMEHCTTRFFEQCDSDSDKYIALEEWAKCFGIKDQDVDKDLVI